MPILGRASMGIIENISDVCNYCISVTLSAGSHFYIFGKFMLLSLIYLSLV